MNFKASRITTGNLENSFELLSGDPITIFGIVIANQTNAVQDIEIDDENGNVILVVTVGANSTWNLEVPFVADKGISIAALGEVNVHVTFFHSHP
jgi:hypothetical protein